MPFSIVEHGYVSSPRSYNSTAPTNPTRLLLIGLPSSGKSTLFRLFRDDLERGQEEVDIDTQRERLAMQNDVVETMGLHRGEVLGYRRTTRASFREASAVIFLHDVTQGREGRDEVKRQVRALDALLGEGVPILVLVNKVDLIEPIYAPSITWNRLGLGRIDARRRRPIGLFLSSLADEVGYQEGLEWLATQASQNIN